MMAAISVKCPIVKQSVTAAHIRKTEIAAENIRCSLFT